MLWQLLREPKYRLNMRLAAGELIAYDNNRVLHGRSAFDASSGERHLQGCYLNQEDLDSTLRLLDRKTG
ncbi:MAG: TauD/TfdA family dioxygenase [Chloroflexi bacterium]|nr:TauD/TfdA family dioxygenase [Chloroflexota bacterium]